MKKKMKKILLATCCLAMVSGVAFATLGKEVDVAAESVGGLIDGSGIYTEYSYANESGRKGFLISADNDTKPTSLQRTFAGGFEMEFETLYGENKTYGAGHIAFQFTADSGETFTLHIKRDGTLSSAYVESKGEKMGINTANTGFTALLNKSGTYTSLYNSSKYIVKFNPTEMKVYVNSVLIWDFSEENNDGRNVGFSYAPFETYNVDFAVSEISGTSKMLVYQINGEDLSGTVLKDTGAPMIFVEKEADAVVGKAYAIPQPVAYDFTDDNNVSNVAVEVYAPNGKRVALAETTTFVPEMQGEYVILYKATDKKGNVGVYDLKVTAKESYETEILLSEYLHAETPKNSEITIPAAMVISNVFDYQYVTRYANVSVLLNGEEVVGVSGEANQPKTLQVTQAGEYIIVYTYEKNGLDERVEYTLTVTQQGYSDFAVGEYYVTGDCLQIPTVTYFDGARNTEATAVLTLPSGKTVNSGEVVFEEVGEYTLYYTADSAAASSKKKHFMVTYESSDLFEVNYGTLKSDYSSINNDLFGVQASLTAAGSITYKNVIDFTGKTQDDTFLELIATPSKYYNVDFTQFLIRLTDTEDPNNWVEIKAFDMASNRADGTYVRAKRNGTPYVAAQDGYTTSKPGNPGYGGYPVLHSFRGNVNSSDYKEQTLKFGYDPEKKTLYCESNGMDSNKYGRILADLCDPTWCGEWDGFTNNTVYLTITCASIVTTANFAILTVDDKDLTSENRRVIPAEAPELRVPTQTGKEMPKGVVGKAYAIPECLANDAFNQALKVNVNVYRDYGLETQTEIVHTDYFTPEVTGAYTIVYSATDYLGRTTKLEKAVTVYSENAYAQELKWNYEFTQIDKFTDLSVGKYIGIPDCVWSGGAGDTQTFIDVYDPNGDLVEILQSKNMLTFFADMAGRYTVEYRAVDYLNEEVVYAKTFDVKDSLVPVLKEEIMLPDYAIDGIKMTLPMPTAYDYKAGDSVNAKIVVTDGDGEKTLDSNVYTPSIANHGDLVSIAYVYGEGENALRINATMVGLKVKDAENGLDMTKYFIANAGEFTADTDCITYTTNTPESVLTFAKSIPVNGFKFVYNVGAGKDETWGNVAFNGVEIVLSDSADPYYKVVLQFTAMGDGAQFSINGETPVKTVGSFTAESLVDMQFSYASTTHDIFNIKGTKIGTIKKYATGEDFKGFPSGEVYMSVRMLGVTGAASIKLYSINEQPLSAAKFDRIKPVIISTSDAGSMSVGDTVEVSTAYATDILSNVGEVTVNVKTPSGLYVTAVDGTTLKNVSASKVYQFVCEEVGTYDIRYSVKDSSGNNGQLKRLVNVSDKVPPVVTLNGAVLEKVKVNKEITLPTAVVEDTSECTVSVMIYEPYSATYASVSDYKYTFKSVGTYTVRYFVFDSFYNCVILDYTVVVY